MSVDYQEDLVENWEMAQAMPGPEAADGQSRFANLNQALEEAGSVIGDMHANLPIAFRFKWHEMAIFCQIVERDGEVVLELATDLGPVPFTIENRQRRGYLKELCQPSIELPVGEYVVTERRRFRHRMEAVLTAPITGGAVVTAVVRCLLGARPYYELAKTPQSD